MTESDRRNSMPGPEGSVPVQPPTQMPGNPVLATSTSEDGGRHSPEDFIRILQLLWRHKILIVSLLAIGALSGFLLAQRATPIYQSAVRLNVIYRAPTQINTWDPGPSDNTYQRFFESILHEATSRNVMNRAADRILARQDIPSLRGASREAVVEYLQKGAAVMSVNKTNHVDYVFSTTNQGEASAVLAYLWTAFRDDQRHNESLMYQSQHQAVYQDVIERENEYRGARDTYIQYLATHKIDDPDVAKMRYSQQMQEIKQRMAANQDEIVRRQNMLGIVDPEDDADILNWALVQPNNWILQQQQQELDRIKREYADKSKMYDDNHPEMILLRDSMSTKISEMIRFARTRYKQEKQGLDSVSAAQADLDKRRIELEAEIATNSPILDQARRLKEAADIAKINFDRVSSTKAEIGSQTFRQFTEIRQIDAPTEAIQIYPRITTFVGSGGLLGGLLACVIVLLWSRIDNTLKTSVQVPRELGVPTLGTVLFSPAIGPDPSGLPLVARMPRSPEAEAMFIVWANIANRLNYQPGQCKVLMFTSSIPEEGKSTTSANIAAVAAQQNQRVLLIDMDLRRPSLHNYFGITNAVGCMQALNRQMRREQCIQRTAVKNLDIMTTGVGEDHPNELVSPANLMGLVAWARANYDLVVLDTPPLLLAADGLIVSRFVDGSVLLIHGGQTPLDTVTRSRDMLINANANLLGAVLNDRTGAVDDRDRAYYYKYSAYYHPAVNE